MPDSNSELKKRITGDDIAIEVVKDEFGDYLLTATIPITAKLKICREAMTRNKGLAEFQLRKMILSRIYRDVTEKAQLALRVYMAHLQAGQFNHAQDLTEIDPVKQILFSLLEIEQEVS